METERESGRERKEREGEEESKRKILSVVLLL